MDGSHPGDLGLDSARHGAWRSLVAHLAWVQEVGGSNPPAPISRVKFWQLGEAVVALPFDRQRAITLDATLDLVRDSFGSDAITRAVLLRRDEGVSMPLLPDSAPASSRTL
jgi:hypothetical protein